MSHQEKPGEPWSVGSRRFSKYAFTFRHGPGVVENTVPADVRYLVLVLNGRTDEKVTGAAVRWREFVLPDSQPQASGIRDA